MYKKSVKQMGTVQNRFSGKPAFAASPTPRPAAQNERSWNSLRCFVSNAQWNSFKEKTKRFFVARSKQRFPCARLNDNLDTLVGTSVVLLWVSRDTYIILIVVVYTSRTRVSLFAGTAREEDRAHVVCFI